MKKFLLLLSSLVAIANVNAQITITQWDVAGVGKQLIVAHDTLKANNPGAINPGSAGASQNWSFSTLASHTTDTLTFTNPMWIPSHTVAPNANLAMINSTDSSIAFLRNISSGLFIDGFYGNIGAGFMGISMSPSQEIDAFSDTYGNSFTNSSKIDFTFPYNMAPVDSVRVKQIVDQNSKTDGWGNITTPLGTYASIRHRNMQITTDTVWIHYLGTWMAVQNTLDTAYHFSWWAKNVGYALLEFDSLKADTVRNISWLKVVPFAGAVNAISSLNSLHIYPNPTTSQINFELKNPEITSIEIFDLAGNRIAIMPANKNDIVTYNAENLSSGTYFFRTANAEGETLNRGKFDVVK